MTMKKLELIVEASSGLTYSKGNFGTKVENKKLLIPLEIYGALTDNNKYKEIESMISLIDTFPTSIAKRLGWTVGEVKEAYNSFLEQVKPYLSEGFVKILEREPIQRTYGAMPPSPDYIGKTPEQLENMKKN